MQERILQLVKLLNEANYNYHVLDNPTITDQEYDKIFTVDKPIVFAFHGYPSLIHELTYKRTNRLQPMQT